MRQKTNGTAINLGSTVDTTANTLELSEAELDRITATELHIGDANSGAITVSSDINLSTASTAGGGTVPTLCLTTGSTVTGTAGGIVVSDLSIVAAGAVNFTDATTNVTNLAIDTSTGNVTFVEADGFTVTTVCGEMGIDTDAGSVSLTATTGNITVANTGATNDIEATGDITISLLANNAPFTINTSADIETSAGSVTVSSDKMDLDGSITTAAQTVTLRNSVGADAINLGSATDAAASTLELSDAELDRITATRLIVGSATMGAITVSSDIDLTDSPTIPTLHLITNSTVTATAGGIEVSDLAISANGAVNFTDGTTDVNRLAILTATGNVTFVDATGFSVDTVDGVNGIDTNSGTVSLTATTGNLTVVNTAATNDIEATGNITISLLANDALFTINTSADVETSTGSVTVSSDKMDLAGSITTAAQTVTLKNSVGADAINLGSVTNAAANTLELSDAELDRITAARLIVGSATMDAITVSSNINLTDSPTITTLHLVTNAGITATAAGLQVSNLAISANGDLLFTSGTTDVNTLAVNTTGEVRFTDTDALTIGTVDGVIGLTTTNDDVTLTTGGNLTIDNDVNLGTGNLLLDVTGNVSQNAGDTIVASGLALMVSGTTTLTQANDINTLALDNGGAVQFTDGDDLTVGSLTVHGTTVTGIATTDDNVTLVTGGALTISDDIALGLGNLTLNSAGAVTQTSGDEITAAGLQLLGAGPFTLEEAGNDVTTLAANTTGAVAYRDANGLTIGTVGATSGITTTDDNVTVCLVTGNLTVSQVISAGTATVRLQTLGGGISGAGTITAAAPLDCERPDPRMASRSPPPAATWTRSPRRRPAGSRSPTAMALPWARSRR